MMQSAESTKVIRISDGKEDLRQILHPLTACLKFFGHTYGFSSPPAGTDKRSKISVLWQCLVILYLLGVSVYCCLDVYLFLSKAKLTSLTTFISQIAFMIEPLWAFFLVVIMYCKHQSFWKVVDNYKSFFEKSFGDNFQGNLKQDRFCRLVLSAPFVVLMILLSILSTVAYFVIMTLNVSDASTNALLKLPFKVTFVIFVIFHLACLHVFYFISCCAVLKMLRSFNKRLESVAPSSTTSFEQVLPYFLQVHCQITNTISLIDDFFLAFTAISIPHFILTNCHLINNLLFKSLTNSELACFGTVLMLLNFLIFATFFLPSKVFAESQAALPHLYELSVCLQSSQVRLGVHHHLAMLVAKLSSPIGMSAPGTSYISGQTMLSMSAAILTYTVLVFQLDKSSQPN